MATAFQATAFQNNAFQIDDARGGDSSTPLNKRLWWQSPPKSKRKQRKALTEAIERTVEAARAIDPEAADKIAETEAKVLAHRMLEEATFAEIAAKSQTVGDLMGELWRQTIERDDERIILQVLQKTIH